MLIYLVKNKINEKIYVGKTSFSLEKRWNEHVMHSRSQNHKKQLITRAIRKYGSKNFEISLLEQCQDNNHANECEIMWIKKLNSRDLNVGYNLTDGGEGTPGRVVSEIVKQKMRNRIVSIETRKKISQAKRGKKLSETARLANLKSRPRGEKHPNFGKSWSKSYNHTAETKKKLSIAHSGKVLTEEHRNSISNGLKKAYEDKNGVNLGMCWYISGFWGDKLVSIHKNFEAVAVQFDMNVKTLRKKIKNGELLDGIRFVKSSRCSISELEMKILSLT